MRSHFQEVTNEVTEAPITNTEIDDDQEEEPAKH
jgi:hypothetical protein